MKRIALVTQRLDDGSPLVSNDARLLAAQSAAHGLELVDVPWEDSGADWDSFDAVILKSTWNYHLPQYVDSFRAWMAARDAQRLWNPAPVVRWNSDKRYLRELGAAGVPIVPSVWRDAGEALGLAAVMDAQGWPEIVVKPRTSASAFGLAIARTPAEAAAIEARAAEFGVSGAVIQPILPEIHTGGEWSFLFFLDTTGTLTYSHAALKHPPADKITVQDGTYAAATPPQALIAQAADILRAATDHIGQPLLYARVDAVVRGGTLTLMELELIEPSLYLNVSPPEAAARMLSAIAISAG